MTSGPGSAVGSPEMAGPESTAVDEVSFPGLVVAGERLSSRLLLGSGGVSSLEVLDRVIAAARPALVTVALRRVDPAARGSLTDVISSHGLRVLPNTAGCFTARDAVTTARLGREALGREGSAPRHTCR